MALDGNVTTEEFTDFLRLVREGNVSMRCSSAAAAMQANCPLISRLPNELLDAITECLRLPDYYQLQKTCKFLYLLFRRRFRAAFRAGPEDEKLECLTINAYHWVDKWACDSCIALHSILWNDIPHHTRRSDGDLFPCPNRAPFDTHIAPTWSDYDTDYHHVQLALKYHRFNLTTLQRHYLELLLDTHFDSLSRAVVSIDTSFRAEHRVIKGHYLRKSVLMFRSRSTQLSYEDLGNVQACRHLNNYLHAEDGTLLTRLRNALTKCLMLQRICVVFCRECATEVEISCSTGKEPWLCLVVYQDFGTEDDVPGHNGGGTHWHDSFTQYFEPTSFRRLWGDSYPSCVEPFLD